MVGGGGGWGEGAIPLRGHSDPCPPDLAKHARPQSFLVDSSADCPRSNAERFTPLSGVLVFPPTLSPRSVVSG